MKNTDLPVRALPLILIACSTVIASSPASDPFVGKWKLNTSRSTIADQMSIQAVGDNKYGLTFSGGGEPETVTADGSDQPGASGTILSVTVEAPGRWKIIRKSNGQVLITAIWTLSKDGKTLNDAFTTTGSDGSTSTVNMIYKRRAGDSGIPGTWETTDVKVEGVHELEIRPYEMNGLSLISSDAPSAPKNIKFDGKEVLDPTTGATSGTAYSGHRMNERSLEYATKIHGKIAQTREMTVSPDLKTLTIVVHPNNQRLPNTLVFDRT